MKSAIYAGSFDPITNGHLWVMQEALKLFDNLIIAIARNPDKKYAFSFRDRFRMIDNALGNKDGEAYHLEYIKNDLLVKYAKQKNVKFLIRGIRNGNDYMYENGMRHINGDIDPHITTIYLIPPRHLCEISSSLVKGLIGFDGWEKVINQYVPESSFNAIKWKKKRIDG